MSPCVSMRHFWATHWNMSPLLYFNIRVALCWTNRQAHTGTHKQGNMYGFKYVFVFVYLWLCVAPLHLVFPLLEHGRLRDSEHDSELSMVACEKQSWNNLRCITFPCGERRINNSNYLIYMYNSNRPRSPLYIGTGHFRHNHFKDIVWYSSITKMVLYVQCDLWTFCGALKTDFLDLYRSSMSTTMGVQKYRWKIVICFAMSKIIRHFAPFCLSPPPPLFPPPPGPLPQWPSCQWQKQKSIRDGPTNTQYGWGLC